MCAALTDKDTFDLCAADGTLLVCASIDSKVVLEFTATINPIKGCSVTADSLIQHIVDRFMQRLGLFRRYRIGRGQWMQLGGVQGFIYINIAKPRKERLIQ